MGRGRGHSSAGRGAAFARSGPNAAPAAPLRFSRPVSEEEASAFDARIAEALLLGDHETARAASAEFFSLLEQPPAFLRRLEQARPEDYETATRIVRCAHHLGNPTPPAFLRWRAHLMGRDDIRMRSSARAAGDRVARLLQLTFESGEIHDVTTLRTVAESQLIKRQRGGEPGLFIVPGTQVNLELHRGGIFREICERYRGKKTWGGIEYRRITNYTGKGEVVAFIHLSAVVDGLPVLVSIRDLVYPVLLSDGEREERAVLKVAMGSRGLDADEIPELSEIAHVHLEKGEFLRHGSFGAPERAEELLYPETSLDELLGPPQKDGTEGCQHPEGDWRMNLTRDAFRFICQMCGHPAGRCVPVHMARPDSVLEAIPDFETTDGLTTRDYLESQAIYDILNGREPLGDIAELRSRDGQIDLVRDRFVGEAIPRCEAPASSSGSGPRVSSVAAAMRRR